MKGEHSSMKELFIPTRINKDNIFGKGYGKAEMRRLTITILIGVAVGAVVGISWFNKSLQDILVASVAGGIAFAFFGYILFTKNSINLSAYHYILLFRDFMLKQQMYRYKRLNEWGKD